MLEIGVILLGVGILLTVSGMVLKAREFRWEMDRMERRFQAQAEKLRDSGAPRA